MINFVCRRIIPMFDSSFDTSKTDSIAAFHDKVNNTFLYTQSL